MLDFQDDCRSQNRPRIPYSIQRVLGSFLVHALRNRLVLGSLRSRGVAWVARQIPDQDFGMHMQDLADSRTKSTSWSSVNKTDAIRHARQLLGTPDCGSFSAKSILTRKPAACDTANLRTNIMDFRGFDSSIILIVTGGIPRPIGNFPESLSQAILVGIMFRPWGPPPRPWEAMALLERPVAHD